MFSRSIKTVAVYLLVLLLATSAFGQQTQGQTQSKPESQYVDFTGFKGKVFEVKYRNPSELTRVLSPLGSGFKGATMSYNDELKILTVRDFPENIAAIEEALKRLDVPTQVRPASTLDSNVELHMHVLLASNIEGASNTHPAELNDVLKQLQSTLNYKNYYLVTSIVQRTKEYNARARGGSALNGSGTAEVGAPFAPDARNPQTAKYEYRINSIVPMPVDSGAPVIQLDDFSFALGGDLGSASIHSGLSARDGEKIVVGTAGMKDKAMILVLSVKVVK